jgi:hypothetical protein
MNKKREVNKYITYNVGDMDPLWSNEIVGLILA